MQQQNIIFDRSESSVLKKIPVESFPVITDKKLSSVKVVGDFSMVPTNAVDHIGLIGRVQLGMKIPSGTKSAKKGYRLTAKW